MATRLKILVSTLLLSLTAFSQTDTSKICLSHEIATKIAIDIVSGDSAKAELKETKELLLLTEQKVSLKDSIIATHQAKETNYKNQIFYYQEKERLYVDRIGVLENKNRNLKLAVKALGGTTIICGLLVILL